MDFVTFKGFNPKFEQRCSRPCIVINDNVTEICMNVNNDLWRGCYLSQCSLCTKYRIVAALNDSAALTDQSYSGTRLFVNENYPHYAVCEQCNYNLRNLYMIMYHFGNYRAMIERGCHIRLAMNYRMFVSIYSMVQSGKHDVLAKLRIQHNLGDCATFILLKFIQL